MLALYVIWVWCRPRTVGRHGWSVTLPGGPLTLLQIGIGIVDLWFCALAMYMLVPAEPNIGFITLAVIFVAATLLGFASHAPGGLGVFDAAMLVALWQFDKEDLLAGLLLFRLLYYIVPFAISLLILGGREILLALRASVRARRLRRPSLSRPKPADARGGRRTFADAAARCVRFERRNLLRAVENSDRSRWQIDDSGVLWISTSPSAARHVRTNATLH